MGQANISKAKYLQPSRRKSTSIKCVVCGKMTRGQYELCHRHYIEMTNTPHRSRINIKKVVIFMKQIREEYSQSTGKVKA